jgi:hypothetical protein
VAVAVLGQQLLGLALLGSGRRGAVGGAVGRVVVDDDDLFDQPVAFDQLAPDAIDDRADGGFFVERRKEDLHR